MISCRAWFNLYLVAALLLSCSCQSPESKKKRQISTLRIHVEAGRELPDRTRVVSLPRSHPMPVTIQNDHFLTEAYVAKAEIIDAMGGFALRIQFGRQGTWLLEQYSAGNVGKRFAIFSQFVIPPGENLNEGRWLAAPKITRRIADGILTFTPDASREEAEQIVLGLSNLARDLAEDNK